MTRQPSSQRLTTHRRESPMADVSFQKMYGYNTVQSNQTLPFPFTPCRRLPVAATTSSDSTPSLFAVSTTPADSRFAADPNPRSRYASYAQCEGLRPSVSSHSGSRTPTEVVSPHTLTLSSPTALLSSAPEWHAQFYKTKLCPYFVRDFATHVEADAHGPNVGTAGGFCVNGGSCRFAHSVSELRPLPDLRQTKLCASYAKHLPCRNTRCPFAHSPRELRTSSSVFYKVTLCNFYRNSKCWNGPNCRFAHGVEELRNGYLLLQNATERPPPPPPTQDTSGLSRPGSSMKSSSSPINPTQRVPFKHLDSEHHGTPLQASLSPATTTKPIASLPATRPATTEPSTCELPCLINDATQVVSSDEISRVSSCDTVSVAHIMTTPQDAFASLFNESPSTAWSLLQAISTFANINDTNRYKNTLQPPIEGSDSLKKVASYDLSKIWDATNREGETENGGESVDSTEDTTSCTDNNTLWVTPEDTDVVLQLLLEASQALSEKHHHRHHPTDETTDNGQSDIQISCLTNTYKDITKIENCPNSGTRATSTDDALRSLQAVMSQTIKENESGTTTMTKQTTDFSWEEIADAAVWDSLKELVLDGDREAEDEKEK